MQAEKPSNIWKAVQALGIVIAILGILLTVYSGYLITTVPMGLQHRFSNNVTVPGNYTYRFNRSSAGSGYRAGGSPSFGNIFSGVLMILLGLLTFKYAGLKIATSGIKTRH